MPLRAALATAGIAVIGQAGDDGVRLVEREMMLQRRGIAGVERHGAQAARTMRLDHGLGRGGVDIAQSYLVIAGFGQQAADEGADLAGTQDQNFVHGNLVCG